MSDKKLGGPGRVRAVCEVALVISGAIIAICLVSMALGLVIRGLSGLIFQLAIPVFAVAFIVCIRHGWLSEVIDAIKGRG